MTNNPIKFVDPTGHYIFEDEPDDEYFYYRDDGDSTPARSKEKIYDLDKTREPDFFLPVKFLAGLAVAGAFIEPIIAETASSAFWRIAQTCVGSAICRWATGMAGGVEVAVGNEVTEVTDITPCYPPHMGAAEGEWAESWAFEKQTLSRFGNGKGNFFSKPGTPWWKLSLPGGQPTYPARLFQVNKPFPMYESHAISWFNQPGGGVQYRTLKYMTLDWLAENNYLKPLE